MSGYLLTLSIHYYITIEILICILSNMFPMTSKRDNVRSSGDGFEFVTLFNAGVLSSVTEMLFT